MSLEKPRTLADLEGLIRSGVQESLTLDYKQSAALQRSDECRREISKDVSAFANSAGGQIIYGVGEDGHFPKFIDAGADPDQISKEWLEQVIASTISPRPDGIEIWQIPLASGRVVYVVDIPQATALAPHQAKDRRYYRRGNFESRPMEDYEVRDTMRRQISPSLYLSFVPRDIETVLGREQYYLGIRIGNESAVPVLYRVFSLFIDVEILLMGPERLEFSHFPDFDVGGGVRAHVGRYRGNEWVPNHMPIFREYEFHLGDLVLRPDQTKRRIGYSIAAPGFSDERYGWVWVENGQVHIDGLRAVAH